MRRSSLNVESFSHPLHEVLLSSGEDLNLIAGDVVAYSALAVVGRLLLTFLCVSGMSRDILEGLMDEKVFRGHLKGDNVSGEATAVEAVEVEDKDRSPNGDETGGPGGATSKVVQADPSFFSSSAEKVLTNMVICRRSLWQHRSPEQECLRALSSTR
jgi:hypothetical protein